MSGRRKELRRDPCEREAEDGEEPRDGLAGRLFCRGDIRLGACVLLWPGSPGTVRQSMLVSWLTVSLLADSSMLSMFLEVGRPW